MLLMTLFQNLIRLKKQAVMFSLLLFLLPFVAIAAPPSGAPQKKITHKTEKSKTTKKQPKVKLSGKYYRLENIPPQEGGGKRLKDRFMFDQLQENRHSVNDLKQVHSLPPHIKIRQVNFDVWDGDEHLKMIVGLKDVEKISLGGETTNKGLAYLKAFPKLKVLVTGATINGPGMLYLKGVPQLKVLIGEINGPGMLYLKEIPQLEKLNFSTDEGHSKFYRPLLTLKKLKYLNLSVGSDMNNCSEFDDKGLEVLGKLKQVDYLEINLGYTSITSHGLAQFITNMKHLKKFILKDAPRKVMTTEVITAITKLKHIRRVQIPYIDNKDLLLIAKMKNIREFIIGHHRINLISYGGSYTHNNDLSMLKGATQLEVINFAGSDWATSVPQSGIKYLKDFPKIKKVSLYYKRNNEYFSQIGDVGLRLHIAPLKNLEEIIIVNQPYVTRAGLMSLTKLTQLKKLRISGSPQITEEDIKAFEKELAKQKLLEKKKH